MEKYLGYIDKAVQLAKLKEQIEQCTKCRNLVESRKLYPYGKGVIGYGNLDSKLFFCGEAPGHLGCGRTGKPFMGDRSGEMYFKALKESGLEYDQVYTTNIVKCCPLANRTPIKEEIENCRIWLKKEIDIVNPRIIVCLGRTAANWFGLRQSLNSLVDIYNYEGRLVKVLYHPAYPLRCGSQAVLQWITLFKLTIRELRKNESI
jgi:DNA polymerase